MKKVKLLLCMLSLAALGVLTACDDDDGGGSGGGGGGTNDVVAPANLDDRIMNVTINSGTAPFAESGTYSITFGPADSGTYTINDDQGGEVSTGTYTYTPGTDNTASLVLEDSALGTINSALTFDSETSGTMESTDTTGGSESSTFTLN
jgi:hypothetical protein